MSALRITYLALAVIGAIFPMWHLIGYLFSEGGSLFGMLALWTENSAVTALSFDLLISGTVLIIWIIAETLVRKNWIAFVAIPATFVIGVSCGLPLYLFLRTRPV